MWSPDSRFLMSASSDSTVKIWNFLKANKNCSKGKSLKKSSEFKSMLIKDLPGNFIYELLKKFKIDINIKLKIGKICYT